MFDPAAISIYFEYFLFDSLNGVSSPDETSIFLLLFLDLIPDESFFVFFLLNYCVSS